MIYFIKTQFELVLLYFNESTKENSKQRYCAENTHLKVTETFNVNQLKNKKRTEKYSLINFFYIPDLK